MRKIILNGLGEDQPRAAELLPEAVVMYGQGFIERRTPGQVDNT